MPIGFGGRVQMGLFNKRYSADDFYGFVVKAIGTSAMAVEIKTVNAMERQWRAEFEAYGLTAEDFVQAWLIPPEIDALLAAWREWISYLEEHDPIGTQMFLTKIMERTHGLPVSPTIPPTFVITSWKLAGCPDASTFVRRDGPLAWGRHGPLDTPGTR
jgi:hypothetical protein